MHRRYASFLVTVCLLTSCAPPATVQDQADTKALAERFFRGVYGCDPSVVAELAGDSVSISYPIFTEVFGTPVIRGRDRVDEFARGFCSRWRDAEIVIHESIADSNRVVLLWGFSARNVASGARVSWGGVSLLRFDASGKIVAEIGEESTPGPVERAAEQVTVPDVSNRGHR